MGYANASKAICDHVDEDDKLNNESLSSLGQRGGWLINESGSYSLIMSSKLPESKSFRCWITHEVIPSIRKHGGYLTPKKVEEVLLNPDTIIRLATQLKEERARSAQLTAQNAVQSRQIAEMQPKNSYRYNSQWQDRIRQSGGCHGLSRTF